MCDKFKRDKSMPWIYELTCRCQICIYKNNIVCPIRQDDNSTNIVHGYHWVNNKLK